MKQKWTMWICFVLYLACCLSRFTPTVLDIVVRIAFASAMVLLWIQDRRFLLAAVGSVVWSAIAIVGALAPVSGMLVFGILNIAANVAFIVLRFLSLRSTGVGEGTRSLVSGLYAAGGILAGCFLLFRATFLLALAALLILAAEILTQIWWFRCAKQTGR